MILLNLILLSSLYGYGKAQNQECPPGCLCEAKKVDSLPNNESGLRLQCLPTTDYSLNLSSLPENTIQLDLSKYGLSTISPGTFHKIRYCEKLDLSRNNISRLEDGTFEEMTRLKTLDLSDNRIQFISVNAFEGLERLAKLLLNGNLLQQIQYGVFSSLHIISKISLMDNPLSCNCSLLWILDWTHVELSARCKFPLDLEGRGVNSLKVKDFRCDGQSTINKIEEFLLEPQLPQIVFEGDTFRIKCSVGASNSDVILRWFHNRRPILGTESILITNLSPRKDDLVTGYQTHLTLTKVTMGLSGIWTCSSLLQSGYQEERSINLVVISPSTVLCPSVVTNTTKGIYEWGAAVAGQTLKLPCQKAEQKPALATYQCNSQGYWGHLNLTSCLHISDVTDKLYKFSRMNYSGFDENTLLQAAGKLLDFTKNSELFTDGVDVVYLTRCVENYLPHLDSINRLSPITVGIVANMMRLNPQILADGQLTGIATSRILGALADITKIVPTPQETGGLVVSGLSVSPKHFSGITCTWFAPHADFQPNVQERLFYCTENNQTLGIRATSTLGSVQIPSTLYYQFTLLDKDVNTAKQLFFFGFNNSVFFPLVTEGLSDPKSLPPYQVVSKCVIGAGIVNQDSFNLSEPVYIILEKQEVDHSLSTMEPMPAWWDSKANRGLGSWSPGHCKLLKARKDNSVFSCNRLGFYALVSLSDEQSGVSRDIIVSSCDIHPAIYFGSLLAIVGLGITVLIYTILWEKIRLLGPLKHCLCCTWISTLLLLAMWTGSLCVLDEPVCLSACMSVYYLSLTAIAWLLLAAYTLFQVAQDLRSFTSVSQENKMTSKLSNFSSGAAVDFGGKNESCQVMVTAGGSSFPVSRGSHLLRDYELQLEPGSSPARVGGRPSKDALAAGDGKRIVMAGQFYMPRYYLGGWVVPLLITGVCVAAGHLNSAQEGIYTTETGFCLLSSSPSLFILLSVDVILVLAIFYLLILVISSTSRKPTKKQTAVEGISESKDAQYPRRNAILLMSLTVLIVSSFICFLMSTWIDLDDDYEGILSGGLMSILFSVLSSTLAVFVFCFYCFFCDDIKNNLLPSRRAKIGEDDSNLINLAELRSNRVQEGRHIPDKPNNLTRGQNKDGTKHEPTATIKTLPHSNQTSTPGPQRFSQPHNRSDDRFWWMGGDAYTREGFNAPVGGSVLGPSSGMCESGYSNVGLLKVCNLPPVSKASSHDHLASDSQMNLYNRPHSGLEGYVPPANSVCESTSDIFTRHTEKPRVRSANIQRDEHKFKVNKATWDSSHRMIGGDSVHPEDQPDGDGGEFGHPTFTSSPFAYDTSRSNQSQLTNSGQLRRTKIKERMRAYRSAALSGHSDLERSEVGSTSRFSEVSSYTGYSSKSKSKKNKPRRKLRKRSEVLNAQGGFIRQSSQGSRGTNSKERDPLNAQEVGKMAGGANMLPHLRFSGTEEWEEEEDVRAHDEGRGLYLGGLLHQAPPDSMILTSPDIELPDPSTVNIIPGPSTQKIENRIEAVDAICDGEDEEELGGRESLAEMEFPGNDLGLPEDFPRDYESALPDLQREGGDDLAHLLTETNDNDEMSRAQCGGEKQDAARTIDDGTIYLSQKADYTNSKETCV